MFGIGLPEMILILALALIVVGPDKLPELARSVAKGVMELKKTVSTLKEDLADENPFDAVKPELEEAADSIKKQLGEATPDGFTGIVKDLEEGLQEVIDTDGTVIPVSADDIIKTVTETTDSGPDAGESATSEQIAQASEVDNIETDNAGTGAETAAKEPEDTNEDKSSSSSPA